MRSNSARNIRLGIFVVAGMLIFVLTAYLIGNDQNLFQDTFRLNTRFRNVSGLQTGNNVRFSGIHVGTVKEIEMIDDTTIVVGMIIETKMRKFIKTNAMATIGSDGLVGSRVMNIVPGAGEAPEVKAGDFIAGDTKQGTDQMMATLGSTSDNISVLSSRLLQIADDINTGKGTLGLLINDSTMAADLRTAIANLKTTAAKASASMNDINKVTAGLDRGEGLAYAILKDTALAGKFRNTLDDLQASGAHIREVSASLKEITDQLNKEEGALNYLTSDEEALNTLKAILENIEQGTDKFDENMEAMREHILFRGYFRKLEKQQEKQ